MSPSDQTLLMRNATPDDSTQLALVVDMASRRLASHFWNTAAALGQSTFEFGRDIIRNNAAHLSHFSRWRVGERGGQFIGAFNGHFLPPEGQQSRPDSPVALPPYELKTCAAGSWYLTALAILPEYQGLGYALPLLEDAEHCAKMAGASELTLLVGSVNQRAHRLYSKFGFVEWQRRPFVAFDGSDPEGEWILMGKALAGRT